MKLLLMPVLLLSVAATAQQSATPHGDFQRTWKSLPHNPYTSSGLLQPYFSDTLKGRLEPYVEMRRWKPFTIDHAKIDHMPIVVPDNNAIAYMPNPWRGPEVPDTEPMPNPALKPSK